MTGLLRAWGLGDLAARDQLVAVVHQELRRRAAARLRHAVASEMMRRILVDHARRRKMAKRSGGWARVTLDDAVARTDPPDVDLLDLDEALTDLASFDSRKSRVAELRFFGGLSVDETADALGISSATVDREWQVARAWLYSRLTEAPRG